MFGIVTLLPAVLVVFGIIAVLVVVGTIVICVEAPEKSLLYINDKLKGMVKIGQTFMSVLKYYLLIRLFWLLRTMW